MANIKDKLNDIKNAVFGKDVRDSIHDGISLINDEVELIHQKQTDLEIEARQILTSYENANLFNPATATVGGFIGSDGNVVADDNFFYTDYIEVPPFATITYSYGLPSSGGWYDENKKFLSKVLINEGTLGLNPTTTAPSNAKYVRLNCDLRQFNLGSFYVILGEVDVKEYVERYDYNLKLTDNNFTTNSISKETLKEYSPILSNLIDVSKVKEGFIIDKYGKEINSASNVWCTDFIEINPNTDYTFYKTLNYAGYWYDSNKMPIKQLDNLLDKPTLKSPKNAKYVRWNGDSSCNKNTVMIVEGTEYPSEYIKHNNSNGYELKGLKIKDSNVYNEEFINKKYGVFGDSISAINNTCSYRYHDYISDKLNLIKYNYAVGGSGFNVSTSGNDNLIQVIDRVEDELDLITVFMGTNDFGRTTTAETTKPFGSIGDKAEDTFCGAVDLACNKLINKFPNAKILFITPIPRTNKDVANKYNKTLKDYAEAIKIIANSYSIPVLDLYNESNLYVNSEAFITKYMSDGLHINDLGHSRISNKCFKFVINN